MSIFYSSYSAKTYFFVSQQKGKELVSQITFDFPPALYEGEQQSSKWLIQISSTWKVLQISLTLLPRQNSEAEEMEVPKWALNSLEWLQAFLRDFWHVLKTELKLQ